MEVLETLSKKLLENWPPRLQRNNNIGQNHRTEDVSKACFAQLNNYQGYHYYHHYTLSKGRFQKKKRLMEFSIKGPDPASQHPYWKKNKQKNMV